MADATFLFRVSGPTQPLAALSLDASVQEVHAREAVVTEHPVEKGSDVGDHVRPRPITLQVEGLISNTPIGSAVDFARAKNAFAQLEEAWQAGTLFTIYTSLKTYENLVIANLSAPRDCRTGEALRFSATFRQIRVVSTQRVQVPKTKVVAAKPKAKKGKQTGQEAAPQVKKSLAAKLEDFKKSGILKAVPGD